MSHSSRAAIAVLLLLAVLMTTRPAGHQQAAQPTVPERGADLLSLHFAAVTADGTPVTDLLANEVAVRIGGRQRTVRSLQLISMRGSNSADAAEPIVLPPPFGTNAFTAAGRTMVLAIDEDSFRPGAEGPLRQATDTLIARFGPADRVALVTMPFGGIKLPFTTDHSRLRLALSQVVGHAPATETGSEMACRSRRTLEALIAFFETLGVREDPMTMMFVTSALSAPRRDAVAARAPGMCELSENLFSRVAVGAGAARAQFYVIRPGDAPDRGQRDTNIGSDNPIAGIEHLVGVTGGKLLALTGSTGTALARIARETSAYYLANVDTQRNDHSGRSQQLDVRVSRKGVELRSQPHITLARDPATAKLSQPSLRDLLTNVRVFRSLPLRGAAFPALSAEGRNIRVVTLAEAVEPGVKLESAAAVLFTPEGRVAAQWFATPTELQRTPVMGAMDAPPGGYRLRVAAIDSTGRSGTADYDVTAEIVRSGPLKISSLVLGLSRGGAFSPRLQFTTEPLAIAYVELEGAAAGSRISAALEVSETLNGPALATVPLAIERTDDNRYAATGSVPLGALPAGDYVVRAMVGLEGHPMTRVVRTIRKAVLAKR